GDLPVVEVAVRLDPSERTPNRILGVAQASQRERQRGPRLGLPGQPPDRLGVGGLRTLRLAGSRRRSPAAGYHAGWRAFSAARPFSCAPRSSPRSAFALPK